jgi:hypothetical protein
MLKAFLLGVCMAYLLVHEHSTVPNLVVGLDRTNHVAASDAAIGLDGNETL